MLATETALRRGEVPTVQPFLSDPVSTAMASIGRFLKSPPTRRPTVIRSRNSLSSCCCASLNRSRHGSNASARSFIPWRAVFRPEGVSFSRCRLKSRVSISRRRNPAASSRLTYSVTVALGMFRAAASTPETRAKAESLGVGASALIGQTRDPVRLGSAHASVPEPHPKASCRRSREQGSPRLPSRPRFQSPRGACPPHQYPGGPSSDARFATGARPSWQRGQPRSGVGYPRQGLP